MSVVMMGKDEEKPILHDFLGAACTEPFPPIGWAKSGDNRDSGCEAASASASASVGASSAGQGLPPWSSDLVKKRSNSDSAYMGLVRDRMFPAGSDSLESSRLMKMLRKEVVSERLGTSHDDDMLFVTQPPPRPTSSLILHQPISSRPDTLVSKWDQSIPINSEPMVRCASRFGQSGTYDAEKLSSYTYRDASLGVTLISQTAADEGSRTGIKRSGIMNVINPTSMVGERNSTRMLTCSDRSTAPRTIEPEPSNVPSHHITSSSGQMTIFYAGEAHVFDDVHPNKADVIMALAGSNGGSWSTTYSPKSSVHLPIGEAKVPGGINNLASSRDLNHMLSIQENLSHGLSRCVRVPVTAYPPNLTFGRAARDMRPTVSVVEPKADKRDV